MVQWKICWWSSSGMPIMSQITCRGSGPASSATDLARAVGMLGDHRFHQAARPVAHRGLGAGHDLRGERPADDVAQAQMPRVVHDDHRPEELRQLRVRVVDGDARLRAEDVRDDGWRTRRRRTWSPPSGRVRPAPPASPAEGETRSAPRAAAWRTRRRAGRRPGPRTSRRRGRYRTVAHPGEPIRSPASRYPHPRA